MKNFIIRAITGILFVIVLSASFLSPLTMTALFAIITGMTIQAAQNKKEFKKLFIKSITKSAYFLSYDLCLSKYKKVQNNG